MKFDSTLQSLHSLWASGQIAFVFTLRKYFRTSKYTYMGLYSLVAIPPLSLMPVRFCITFCCFVFLCYFYSSSFLLQVHYFLPFLQVLFPFLGNAFYQAMVCKISERDIGTVLYVECSKFLFADLEQLTACCRILNLTSEIFSDFWLCLRMFCLIYFLRFVFLI